MCDSAPQGGNSPMFDRDKRKAVDLATRNVAILEQSIERMEMLREATFTFNQQWHDVDEVSIHVIQLLKKSKMIKVIRFNDGKNYAALWRHGA